MMYTRPNFSEEEKSVFQSTSAFIRGRLADQNAIEWALGLKELHRAERAAVYEAVEYAEAAALPEPWFSAWCWILEAWRFPLPEKHSIDAHQCGRRIKAGDRSGEIIARIVHLVRPSIEVSTRPAWIAASEEQPSEITSVEDLLYIRLSSGEAVKPEEISLSSVTDEKFLLELADDLDNCVDKALNIGRRLDWDEERSFLRLGLLHRVYFSAPRSADHHEPDEFHRGIAPSTKLLWAVVNRISEINPTSATRRTEIWFAKRTPVHKRLWAALARNPEVSPTSAVADFFDRLSEEEFWDFSSYPEIAELRARRFNDLSEEAKARLISRIQSQPPSSLWGGRESESEVADAKMYFAARELRRLELGGASLPDEAKSWLQQKLENLPDLGRMQDVTDGFLDGPYARWIAPKPDHRFDSLSGLELIHALEESLAGANRDATTDWIRLDDSGKKILDALTEGSAFESPKVWEAFGWHHRQIAQDPDRARAVVRLLEQLPFSVHAAAIDGIANWLSDLVPPLKSSATVIKLATALWPIAAEHYNTRNWAAVGLDEATINEDRLSRLNMDALNTAAGNIIGVFLGACPTIRRGNPFEKSVGLRRLRDDLEGSNGAAGELARFRMAQHLSYFFLADPTWTKERLLSRMTVDAAPALSLWQAASTASPSQALLSEIGAKQSLMVSDQGLNVTVRTDLAEQIIYGTLFAKLERRQPPVSDPLVEQMIRSSGDEVRANIAHTPERFLGWFPKKSKRRSIGPEHAFRTAVRPFLNDVWPREKSLVTPGVSAAMARVPGASKNAFASAVDTVERLLVPFECWSLSEYEIFDYDDKDDPIRAINTPRDARALLKLLDLTIGYEETARVPYNIEIALAKAKKIDESVEHDRLYRRLAALSRR